MNEGIISKAQEQKTVSSSKQPQSIRSRIKSMEGEIAKALPSVITPERFTRITLSALSANPKLSECSSKSFLSAMMTAAQLGVEPNTPLGHAYLIPYRNHGQLECQFQLGYRGLIELAYRSGEVKMIQTRVVYENDNFTYEFGLDPKLHHIPAKTDRGAPIFFYATFHTKDGGEGFEIMSTEDIQAHAQKYSKSYSSGPWQTNFEEMAKKTVLKRLLKYAPLKSEFARAISMDGTIKNTISDDMFNEPDITIVDSETGEVVSDSGDGET